MRAKNFAARQSGRSDMTVGLFRPPAKTISSTPASCSRRKPSPAAPRRIVAWGTSARMAGSASSMKARTKNSRSAARHASIMRRGNSPAPARIPSLPTIRLQALSRLADRPARIGADEIDDVPDRLDVAETLGDVVDTLAQRAGVAKELLVGVAQRLDLVARETAALHADDVDAGQARPVAHHRAIGNDVALDPRHAADHRILTDADELMNRRKPADDGVVRNHDMPGERRIVRHHDVASHLAIM